MFHRKITTIRHIALLFYALRIATAAAGMGAIVWWCNKQLEQRIGTDSISVQLLGVFTSVCIGVFAYGLACWILRINELKPFIQKLRRTRGPS